MKKVLCVFVLLGSLLEIRAQETTSSTVDSTERKIDFVFSLGGGVTRYMGDVQDASDRVNVHMIGNRAAFDFTFGALLSKSFTLNFNAVYGKISGNENVFKQHRNFDTKFMLAGASVEYNFAGLYKDRIPVLNPFLVAGAYYGNYWSISTDLQYGDGSEYFYWSDATIRNVEETPDNRPTASNVSRDYNYETSLIKGSIHSFNASAGFGLDLHISRAISLRLMSRYFFAVNDKVDGHYTGDAEGLTDGYFFNSMSLVFNTMAFSKNRKDEKPNYKYVLDAAALAEVENEDFDKDGIIDLADKCANTPVGVKVDADGCPLDSDTDGIPDYRDKSPDSPKDVIVDELGQPVNYQLVAQNWTDSPNVYGMSWDKKYDNPRFRKNEGYTVNVDVVERETIERPKAKVLQIPELRKDVISDSIVVYRLAVYERYDEVEEKRKELNKQGIFSAYSVAENASIESAEKFSSVNRISEESLANSYGIPESIELVKTSKAISSPQLDFAVSRFERYLYNGVPEAALVKDYEFALLAFDSDPIVQNARKMVSEKLDENPLVYLGQSKVTSGLDPVTKSEDEEVSELSLITEKPSTETNKEAIQIAESKIDAEVVESSEEVDSHENLTNEGHTEDYDASKAREEIVSVDNMKLVSSSADNGISESPKSIRETIIEYEKDRNSRVSVDRVTITNPEETKVQEPEVNGLSEEQEVVEIPRSEKVGQEEIIPIVLEGEPLKQAIEEIRATSTLKSQPRINYAPTKPEFKLADTDGDNLISAAEIQVVLEDILKGSSAFTAEEFNRMNAYFTEFTENVEPIDFGGTKVAFVGGKLTILKTEGGEYKSESRVLLAKKYREADFNKDGELTPEEVQKMIDLFLKGGSSYSQERVHELIDLYFD